MQRDSSSPGSGGVAVAGPSGGIAISGGDDVVTSTTTIVSATSATGPVVALIQPGDATEIADITSDRDPAATESSAATPATVAAHVVSGTATYKRYAGYGVANPCMAPRAPVNVEITVHSQNSGRSVTCMNVVSYTELPDPRIVVVINTQTFLQLADTSDAPVYVELSW